MHMRKVPKRKILKKDKDLVVLCLPAIIKIFVFSYLPMVGIIIAFKDYYPIKGIFGSDWNGLKNFEFFFKSSDAWRILRNTVGLNLIMIFSSTLISIIFALLLYEVTKRTLLKIFQSIMFIPYFFSWVLVGLLFTTLLESPSGLLTRIIFTLSGKQIGFYSTPSYWAAILPCVYIWKSTGFLSLIYYAVLMSIDSELFEAAQIDGATKLQTIMHISLPFLFPMMSVQIILAVGNIIHGDFGLFFYVPRNLGVLYPVTDVIDTYVYRALTTDGNFGMSSAVGLFQSFVGCIMILATNKIANRINHDYGLF